VVRELPTPDTLTMSNGPRKSLRELGISAQCQQSSFRTVLNPFALGLVSVALAVVLWGVGYRLSLYRNHPGPSSRITAAKLGVKRHSESLAVSPGIRVKAHLVPSSQALLVRCVASPACGAANLVPDLHLQGFETASYLNPPRSPPARRFLLS
jgi:hypothetical protein